MSAFWRPQAGPQTLGAFSPCGLTLMGGTRGGGKSDAAIGRHIIGAERYGNHWNGLIIRRKYNDFAEMRRRWDELIAAGLPAERIGGDQQQNFIRFANGASVCLSAVQRREQLSAFVGQQYSEITFEEATTLPFFSGALDKLRGSLRSPHGVPCRMFATGNPGGPGHNQVKETFRLGNNYNHPANTIFMENGESRVFIPSFLDDNEILCANDPGYVNRLRAISDPALRKAWIEGDWDTFIGQAFSFGPEHHCEAHPIPPNAALLSTYDWGFGKPFSWGWWWLDNDGRLYRFAEWYGWSGEADKGLRLEDSAIAEGIVERERELGIWGRQIDRLAGPDCFAKRPDYRGGGQLPPTAEAFARYGIILRPGDPSRQSKIRQFRERLRIRRDENGAVLERPMLQVYESCAQFWRTMPALCIDEEHPEDVDSEQEDHVFDEAALALQARKLNIFTDPIVGAVPASGWKVV